MTVHKSYQKVTVFLMVLAALAFILTACGGKPSIKGKWEQVSGEPSLLFFGGPGTLWEFFEDGTVSIGVMGNISGKYSWPDSTHLKIGDIGAGVVYGFAQSVVYEFAQSGDQITLRDPSTQSTIVLKRYKEFSPSPNVLAGDWQKDSPNDSQCFSAFGLDYAPEEIHFGTDGSFSVQSEAGFLSTGISLYGQFSTSGNNLRISATGTKTGVGLFGGKSQEQIGGELSCQVTISHSRLLFKDDQGRVTLYVRAEK